MSLIISPPPSVQCPVKSVGVPLLPPGYWCPHTTDTVLQYFTALHCTALHCTAAVCLCPTAIACQWGDLASAFHPLINDCSQFEASLLKCGRSPFRGGEENPKFGPQQPQLWVRDPKPWPGRTLSRLWRCLANSAATPSFPGSALQSGHDSSRVNYQTSQLRHAPRHRANYLPESDPLIPHLGKKLLIGNFFLASFQSEAEKGSAKKPQKKMLMMMMRMVLSSWCMLMRQC